MEFNVRGENIEVTPALREHVEKKIGKLERYFENNVDAIVHVNLKFYNDQESKVEVTIPMTDLSPCGSSPRRYVQCNRSRNEQTGTSNTQA